jgi:hypothetical protein
MFAFLSTAVAAAGLAPASAQAAITQGAPQQLAGGLTDVQLAGFATGRDGTGGLVYTADSGGVSHAYFSRLLSGVFSSPQQLDSGGATQASVAATNGGELLVTYISGGDLYVEEAPSASQGLSSPQLLASGATNPSISMSLSGVGYVAYTATDGGGDDVDVQYWDGSSWAAASPLSMNNTAGDVAGTGTGAPTVAAASDGVGIVAWGEGGHVYSRRVSGTATSVEVEQDDPASYGGFNESSATAPDVATGGDSSYADIVFTESFMNGSSTFSRALLTRLVAEDTRPAIPIDGLTSVNQDGFGPQVAMGEVGRGIATAAYGNAATLLAPTTGTGTTPTTTTTTTTGTTPTATATTTSTSTTTPSTTTPSTTTPTTTTTGLPGDGATTTPTGQAVMSPYNVEATVLGSNGAPGQPGSQDSNDGAEPVAAPAVFGETTSALAWDDQSGLLSQIELGYAADGADIAPPIAISSATDGSIQPQAGLLLAGDNRGDGAVIWVQGSANGALSLYTEQLYTPESKPILDPNIVDSASSQPTFNWTPAAEYWGPVLYTVALNGSPVANTTSTSQQLSNLIDGTYSWSLVATNTVGNQVASNTGKLLVDTFAPRLRLRITGSPRVKVVQHMILASVDPANPTQPGATASGVKTTTVDWGDGSKPQTGAKLTQATHTYTKLGLYTVTVTATDEVGNTTTLTRLIRVL